MRTAKVLSTLRRNCGRRLEPAADLLNATKPDDPFWIPLIKQRPGEAVLDESHDAFGADPAESCTAGHVHWLVREFGDKWSLPILCQLGEGSLRFLQLKRALGPISQRMLTRTLKKLERNRVVLRTSFGGPSVQVTYELTTFGRVVHQSILRFNAWLADFDDEVGRPPDALIQPSAAITKS